MFPIIQATISYLFPNSSSSSPQPIFTPNPSIASVAAKTLLTPPFSNNTATSSSSSAASDLSPEVRQVKKTWVDKKALLETIVPELRDLPSEKQADIKEFLRRVCLEDIEACCKQMEELGQNSEEVQTAIAQLNWDHPIFHQPSLGPTSELAHRALREYLSGRIDRDSFIDILLYIRSIHLADYGTNETFRLLDKDGSPNIKGVLRLEQELEGFFYNNAVKDLVHQLMQQGINPQRTQFYCVPHHVDEVLEQLVCGVRRHTLLLNVNYHTVISPFLFDALCANQFGDNVIRSNPVLGESKALANFLDPDKRDVAIPCEFLFPRSMPNKLHSTRVGSLTFFAHDLNYHIYIDNCNIHRKAWMELVPLFASKPKVVETLTDRDFAFYGPRARFLENGQYMEDRQKIFRTKFWITLLTQHNLKKNDLIRILNHIDLNKERWKNLYDLEIPSVEYLRSVRREGWQKDLTRYWCIPVGQSKYLANLDILAEWESTQKHPRIDDAQF